MNVFDALVFAEQAHRGQVDKLGEPHFGHVLRVVRNAARDGEMDDVLIPAALHDVVEDTDVTITMLLEAGVPTEATHTIMILTHNKSESYEDYIQRVSRDGRAKAVKRADLQDNMSPERLARLDPKTRERLRVKYESALCLLW